MRLMRGQHKWEQGDVAASLFHSDHGEGTMGNEDGITMRTEKVCPGRRLAR